MMKGNQEIKKSREANVRVSLKVHQPLATPHPKFPTIQAQKVEKGKLRNKSIIGKAIVNSSLLSHLLL